MAKTSKYWTIEKKRAFIKSVTEQSRQKAWEKFKREYPELARRYRWL